MSVSSLCDLIYLLWRARATGQLSRHRLEQSPVLPVCCYCRPAAWVKLSERIIVAVHMNFLLKAKERWLFNTCILFQYRFYWFSANQFFLGRIETVQVHIYHGSWDFAINNSAFRNLSVTIPRRRLRLSETFLIAQTQNWLLQNVDVTPWETLFCATCMSCVC